MARRFIFRRGAALLAGAVLAALLPLHAAAQAASSLEGVLNQMDKAEQGFRTTQASFVWDQYTAVVNETDSQKGKVYFRRVGSEVQMAVDVTDPYAKYVLLSGGKLQLYEPKIDRVTVYNLEKHQGEFESFLRLGFGGGGHAMLKSFEVKYIGPEKIAGTDTQKLDLIPKSPKILNSFPHIELWIDPARGIALQQKLFQAGGDYRLAKYSNILLQEKIPDSVFKLKTTGKTVVQSVSGQ